MSIKTTLSQPSNKSTDTLNFTTIEKAIEEGKIDDIDKKYLVEWIL